MWATFSHPVTSRNTFVPIVNRISTCLIELAAHAVIAPTWQHPQSREHPATSTQNLCKTPFCLFVSAGGTVSLQQQKLGQKDIMKDKKDNAERKSSPDVGWQSVWHR